MFVALFLHRDKDLGLNYKMLNILQNLRMLVSSLTRDMEGLKATIDLLSARVLILENLIPNASGIQILLYVLSAIVRTFCYFTCTGDIKINLCSSVFIKV